MGFLRSFARRLLVQAVVSGTVMVGLQVAVHFGPEVFPPPIPATMAGKPAADPSQTTNPATPSTVVASTSAFAQDHTRTDVKAARLSVWRERDATTAAIAPKRLASKEAGTGLSDVVLFDRCRPDCESRDPLLALNRHPVPSPSPATTTAPEMADDIARASPLGTTETESDASATLNEGIVATAARGGLAVARRIVGTAGGMVGW